MFFDTPNEHADEEFQVLPEGNYRLLVTGSEIKPTKSGEMIVIKLEVAQGPMKGKQCRANFNIKNASETAQRIGRGQFRRFLAAVGVTEPLKTPDEAHRKIANKTLWGEVEHEHYEGKTYAKLKRTADGPPPAKQSQLVQAKDDAEIPF